MKRFFWGLCCPVMSCERYMCEAGIPLSCAVSVMGCVDTNGAREGFWGRGDPWEIDSRRIWLRLPWWFMGLNPGGSPWLLPLPLESSPARPSLLAGCSAQMSPPQKEKVFLNS